MNTSFFKLFVFCVKCRGVLLRVVIDLRRDGQATTASEHDARTASLAQGLASSTFPHIALNCHIVALL